MSAEQHDSAGSSSSALTRRFAITGTLVAGLLAATRAAAAGQASPVPSEVSYLYLQACESGSATLAGDVERAYNVTLQHASGQTLYFSDRPERFAGIIPSDEFLKVVASAEGDPPNAVLAFARGGGSDEVEVAVIELTSPSADPEAVTITYRVRVVEVGPDRDNDAAAGETIQPVTELPASFGQATMFIDTLGSAADRAIVAVNFNHPTRRIGIWKKPPSDG